MKNRNYLKWLLPIITVLVISCDDGEDLPKGKYDGGVFIVNEGVWGQGNGSISYYNQSNDSVYNEIFKAANDRSVGDVAQSLTIHADKAYIVVNASNKIEIVTRGDFIESYAIDQLDNPRFFIGASSARGYLSQWGSDGIVSVVDLGTSTISSSIDVGTGPEKMLLYNDKLYVANSGAYTRDSTISVIDTHTDEVVETIKVGDNPRDLVLDRNGDIWVLCHGYIEYALDYSIASETAGKLVKIDPDNNAVELTLDIGVSDHPLSLEINKEGTKLYYGAGYTFSGIYEVDVDNPVIPTTPLIDKLFYGFNVNQNDNVIFAFTTPYGSNGILHRYSESGTLLGEYEVGLYPNSAVSKREEKN